VNSLFEIVLWGAPALLLSWGVMLTLACAMVFNKDLEGLDVTGDKARR
jgi:hypothetical protein